MMKAAQAMKKAWELFRKAGVKTMEAWKVALRQAWAIVKGVLKVPELPKLSGSEKQIKWANDLRLSAIGSIKKIMIKNISKGSRMDVR